MGECSSDTAATDLDATPSITATARQTIGSLCIVKKLFNCGIDQYGYTKWQNEPPIEGEDLGTCEESLRCAIMLRYKKTNKRNKQDLQDIIIRSKEMRKLLKPTVPGLKDYYDDQEQGIRFPVPLSTLFFNWDQIQCALIEEIDGPIVNLHASLLHDTLKDVLVDQFKRYSELTKDGEITFDLLWTLFKPDADVIASLETETIAAKTSGAILTVPATPGKPYYTVGMSYLEWDGKDFGWTSHSCTISQFAGRMKISSLTVFPMSFHADESHVTTTLSRRGRNFGRLSTLQPHMMSVNSGYEMQNDAGQAWWQPKRTVVVSERVILDTLAWNQHGCGIKRSINEATMKPIDMTAALDSTECDAKNREIFKYCSPYLYGFGLSTKQWVRYPIASVSEVVWDSTAWPSLVLADDYKKLVYAFTKSQLSGKQHFDDFITGKCQGMVMLLSGPPGTGKTLTAESLAEEIQRPLYSVNASELGGTAALVEQGLSLAFDLSARWNAVILLDEADVFLAARSDQHLQRNSVVAVFLRKLEYFKGLVFLTTNRAKGFDTAFESRIHISIKYQDLNKNAREDVWKRFLKNAEDTAEYGVKISPTEIDELADLSLNGRTIRNMVKSGLLLAWNDKEPLQKQHIDVVHRIKQMSAM